MTRIIEEIDKTVKEELMDILYYATIFFLGFLTGAAIASFAAVP